MPPVEVSGQITESHCGFTCSFPFLHTYICFEREGLLLSTQGKGGMPIIHNKFQKNFLKELQNDREISSPHNNKLQHKITLSSLLVLLMVSLDECLFPRLNSSTRTLIALYHSYFLLHSQHFVSPCIALHLPFAPSSNLILAAIIPFKTIGD